MKESDKIKIDRFAHLLYEIYQQGKLSDEVLKRFILTLKDEGMMRYLDEIINRFFEKIRKLKKEIFLLVESADDLSEAEKNRLVEMIKKRFGAENVKAVFKKNEELIGGLRVIVDNKYLIDASFLKYINKIKS